MQIDSEIDGQTVLLRSRLVQKRGQTAPSRSRLVQKRSRLVVGDLMVVVLVWWLGLAVAHGVEVPGLRTYTTKYYMIHTNLSKEEARPYGAHMDLVFAEYRSRFSSFRAKSNAPMPLYLVATREQYLELLDQYKLDGSNSGGMFFVQPAIQGLATWTRDRNKSETLGVLQHEGFHQFAYAYIGPDLPIWVNEGIAQFFEDGIAVNGRLVLGMNNYSRTRYVQKVLGDKRAIEFDDLLTISHKEWNRTLLNDRGRAELLYDQAWSVVTFLVQGGNGKYRPAFDEYLKLVSKGRDDGKAFKTAFGTKDTSQFKQRWVEFARSMKPDPVTMAVKRMQSLGYTLEWLNKKGVAMPKDINELKKALRERRFRFTWSVNGFEEEFDSEDENSYVYPTVSEKEFLEFELTPTASVGNDMPPRISAMKLKPRPMLVWTRDHEGKLVQDVEFK